MSINLQGKIRAALFLTTFSVIGLTGCASVGTVSESNRAVSGQYDGTWLVNVQKSAGLQYVNGWNMQCGDMTNTFPVKVEDGMLYFGNSKQQIKTGVSESGRFKLIVPLGDIASASQQSSTSMANGDVKVILRGSLNQDKQNGHITFGVAEVGYGGCTAKTKFNRAKDTAI